MQVALVKENAKESPKMYVSPLYNIELAQKKKFKKRKNSTKFGTKSNTCTKFQIFIAGLRRASNDLIEDGCSKEFDITCK